MDGVSIVRDPLLPVGRAYVSFEAWVRACVRRLS